MTPFGYFEVARNRASPVPFRRDDGAPLIQRGAQPIIVEGLVAEKSVEFDVLDQGFDLSYRMVMRIRHGASAVDRMWRFLRDEIDFEIVPFDEAQVRAAAVAFDRNGKGVHSQARLNLADCAAYALAMTMKPPLLFEGDDFTATDVRAYL
jgi:uncharacterized protein with PIN domain